MSNTLCQLRQRGRFFCLESRLLRVWLGNRLFRAASDTEGYLRMALLDLDHLSHADKQLVAHVLTMAEAAGITSLHVLRQQLEDSMQAARAARREPGRRLGQGKRLQQSGRPGHCPVCGQELGSMPIPPYTCPNTGREITTLLYCPDNHWEGTA